MTQLQKVIKYLAIYFALFLTFNILSGILYGASFIGSIFVDSKSVQEELKNLEIAEDAQLLDIDVSSSNIRIVSGDTFKVETNNPYIKSRQDKNKLYITESKHTFHKQEENELVVSIPDTLIFDAVAIDTGAGKVDVGALSTQKLYLDLGAGRVEIHNLTVSDLAEIDGGAGEMSIDSSTIHNLSLDMGVGKLSLSSKLMGNSKISAGIGKLDLALIGEQDDYQITLDKGLGSATIAGDEMHDGTSYGVGMHKIDIDGGVGSVDIQFIEKE